MKVRKITAIIVTSDHMRHLVVEKYRDIGYHSHYDAHQIQKLDKYELISQTFNEGLKNLRLVLALLFLY